MNIHQMKRYLKYRRTDTIRAAKKREFDEEVIEFLTELFDHMDVDVEEMW